MSGIALAINYLPTLEHVHDSVTFMGLALPFPAKPKILTFLVLNSARLVTVPTCGASRMAIHLADRDNQDRTIPHAGQDQRRG